MLDGNTIRGMKRFIRKKICGRNTLLCLLFATLFSSVLPLRGDDEELDEVACEIFHTFLKQCVEKPDRFQDFMLDKFSKAERSNRRLPDFSVFFPKECEEFRAFIGNTTKSGCSSVIRATFKYKRYRFKCNVDIAGKWGAITDKCEIEDFVLYRSKNEVPICSLRWHKNAVKEVFGFVLSRLTEKSEYFRSFWKEMFKEKGSGSSAKDLKEKGSGSSVKDFCKFLPKECKNFEVSVDNVTDQGLCRISSYFTYNMLRLRCKVVVACESGEIVEVSVRNENNMKESLFWGLPVGDKKLKAVAKVKAVAKEVWAPIYSLCTKNPDRVRSFMEETFKKEEGSCLPANDFVKFFPKECENFFAFGDNITYSGFCVIQTAFKYKECPFVCKVWTSGEPKKIVKVALYNGADNAPIYSLPIDDRKLKAVAKEALAPIYSLCTDNQDYVPLFMEEIFGEKKGSCFPLNDFVKSKEYENFSAFGDNVTCPDFCVIQADFIYKECSFVCKVWISDKSKKIVKVALYNGVTNAPICSLPIDDKKLEAVAEQVLKPIYSSYTGDQDLVRSFMEKTFGEKKGSCLPANGFVEFFPKECENFSAFGDNVTRSDFCVIQADFIYKERSFVCKVWISGEPKKIVKVALYNGVTNAPIFCFGDGNVFNDALVEDFKPSISKWSFDLPKRFLDADVDDWKVQLGSILPKGFEVVKVEADGVKEQKKQLKNSESSTKTENPTKKKRCRKKNCVERGVTSEKKNKEVFHSPVFLLKNEFLDCYCTLSFVQCDKGFRVRICQKPVVPNFKTIENNRVFLSAPLVAKGENALCLPTKGELIEKYVESNPKEFSRNLYELLEAKWSKDPFNKKFEEIKKSFEETIRPFFYTTDSVWGCAPGRDLVPMSKRFSILKECKNPFNSCMLLSALQQAELEQVSYDTYFGGKDFVPSNNVKFVQKIMFRLASEILNRAGKLYFVNKTGELDDLNDYTIEGLEDLMKVPGVRIRLLGKKVKTRPSGLRSADCVCSMEIKYMGIPFVVTFSFNAMHEVLLGVYRTVLNNLEIRYELYPGEIVKIKKVLNAGGNCFAP